MSSTDSYFVKGFLIIPKLISLNECQELAQLVDGSIGVGAGSRKLLENTIIYNLAMDLIVREPLSELLNLSNTPISCTLFDKTVDRNWHVPFHRDEYIQFESPVISSRYIDWTVKEGVNCAKPDWDILQQLVAVRLSLDDNNLENGPLRLIPGSHVWRSDREYTPTDEIYYSCMNAGDVLVMSPLTLHSSSKILSNNRRRVLHFVFGPSLLPDGACFLKYGAPNESLHWTAK